jgi:hypothetical protein
MTKMPEGARNPPHTFEHLISELVQAAEVRRMIF